MLSSTFSKFSKLEINTAHQASNASAQGRTNLIFIDRGLIRLNGQLANSDDLTSQLKKSEKNGSKIAVVTTSSKTSTQNLIDVLAVLSKIEGLAITIAR